MSNIRYKLLLRFDQSQPVTVTYGSSECRAEAVLTLRSGEPFKLPKILEAKPRALGFVDETDAFTTSTAGGLKATAPKPEAFTAPIAGVGYLLAIHAEHKPAVIERFANPAERYARAEVLVAQSNRLLNGQIKRLTLIDFGDISVAAGQTAKTRAAVAHTLRPGRAQTTAGGQAAIRTGALKKSARGTQTVRQEGATKPAVKKQRARPVATRKGFSRPQRETVYCKALVEVPLYKAWKLLAAVTKQTMLALVNNALEFYISRSGLQASELELARSRIRGEFDDFLVAYRQIAAPQHPDQSERAPTALANRRPPAEKIDHLATIEVPIYRAWKLFAAATGAQMTTVLNDALEAYIVQNQLNEQELAQAPSEIGGHLAQHIPAYKAVVDRARRQATVPGISRCRKRPPAAVKPMKVEVEEPILQALQLAATATSIRKKTLVNFALEGFLGCLHLTENELGRARALIKDDYDSALAAYKAVGERIESQNRAWPLSLCRKRPLVDARHLLIDIEVPTTKALHLAAASTGLSKKALTNYALEEYIGCLRLADFELERAQALIKSDYASACSAYNAIVKTVAERRKDDRE